MSHSTPGGAAPPERSLLERGRDGRRLLSGSDFYDDHYASAALAEEDDELPDKLCFSDQCHGRQEPLARLCWIYEQMAAANRRAASSSLATKEAEPNGTCRAAATTTTRKSSSTKTAFVLITGSAGTGKSRLMSEFISRLEGGQSSPTHNNNQKNNKNTQRITPRQQQPPFLFFSGKFQTCSTNRSSLTASNHDNNGGNNDNDDPQQPPFSAIVQAFSSLGKTLRHRTDRKRITAAVASLMRAGHHELALLLPEFVQALGLCPTMNSGATGNGGGNHPHKSHRNDPNGSRRRDSTINNKDSAIKTTARTASIDVATMATTSHSHGEEAATDEYSGNHENSGNRFKYLFQRLFKALCSPDRPLILFIDDLQWADVASLKLLESLVSDKNQISNLLVVAASRPLCSGAIPMTTTTQQRQQYHHHQRVVQTIVSIEEKHPIERMELLDLTKSAMREFISDSLHLESSSELNLLVDAIHGRTNGNIFFARQALEELFRKGIIYYDIIGFGWCCNVKGIENLISDSVHQAVVSSILAASPSVQRILIVAAYTRSTFDIGTLQLLIDCDGKGPIQEEASFSSNEAAWQTLLDEAVFKGFLANSVGSANYTFAHDRIQESAFSLVPAGRDRDELRLSIGKKLYARAKTLASESWMVFAAADNLNSVSDASLIVDDNNNTQQQQAQDDSMFFLLRINLDCGDSALQVSAYQQSVQYLRKALDYCSEMKDPWGHQYYATTLRLHQLSCEVESMLGNLDASDRLSATVLDNASSMEDKLPTYYSLSVSLNKKGDVLGCVELCKTVLRLLDEMPEGTLTIVRTITNVQTVKRYFRKYSNSEFMSLPRMRDPKKIAAMKFLRQGFKIAYMSGETASFVLMFTQMLILTFRHGISRDTVAAVAAFAQHLNTVGDQHNAKRMAALVHRILDHTRDKQSEKVSRWACVMSVEGWFNPAESCIETLKASGRVAFECGDLASGFTIGYSRNLVAFASGYSLPGVYRDGSKIVDQMEFFHDSTTLDTFQQIRETMKCLLGGDIDWEKVENANLPDGASGTLALQAYLSRLQIAFYFGNLELAQGLAIALLNVNKGDQSYVNIQLRVMFSGLTSSRLAKLSRSTRRATRARISRAQSFTRQMKRLVDRRGPNARHKYLLMDADCRAAQICARFPKRSRRDDVTRLCAGYDKAVDAAVDIGFTHIAAIGSELAGETFHRLDQWDLSKKYFTMARHFYSSWGAEGKIRHLETNEAYAGYFVEPDVQSVRTGEDGAIQNLPLTFLHMGAIGNAQKDLSSSKNTPVATEVSMRSDLTNSIRSAAHTI